GPFHWTADNRRLYDFTSGVLVSNLGHNPAEWMRRFGDYMGWPKGGFASGSGYTPAMAMTAYNAVTPVEVAATSRLLNSLKRSPGGGRMEQVLWAASGSEAIQKAIWAQDRHAHHRAVPRRRRLVPPAEGVPATPRTLLPRERRHLHPRRGAGELRPH